MTADWIGDWFAYNGAGELIGCVDARWTKTIRAAAREFPTAARIELVTDFDERHRLLTIMAGVA